MRKLTLFLIRLAALTLLMSPLASADEVAGKIGYMSGGLIARHADGTFKIMGSKSEVRTGDNLETAEDSYAQVLMNDGTKMTLRPNSNIKIEAYQFKKEAPAEDNAVFRLLKGGFRTVSGLIGKRGNQDAYKLKAMTATIGVRGTDFTTRLCSNNDCDDDSNVKPQPKPEPITVGRVMLVQGEFTAKEPGGNLRKLFVGSSVYEGDKLATAKASNAVVAFRDEGRVSLQEETIFHVEKFQYKRQQGQAPDQDNDNAVLRLIKGGVRVVTGLIGHVNHDRYRFNLTTATIGIRGTGFDAWCNGSCANESEKGGATQEAPLHGAGVYVWAGQVALTTPGATQLVGLGQAAILGLNLKPVPVTTIPASIIQNKTPRPDSLKIDIQKEFENENKPAPAVNNSNGPAAKSGGKAEPGVYVTVHDGQIILTHDNGNTMDVGKGQTGFANEKFLVHLTTTPKFLSGDKQPDPNDSGTGNLNKSSNAPPQNGCQVK